jgi:predicted metal-binding membrane protein
MAALIEHFHRPPWPALFAISAGGYAVSLIGATGVLPIVICGAGEGYWPSGVDLSAVVAAALTLNSPVSLLFGWCIMLVAMMPLLLAAPIVHVRHSSLTRRRARAVTVFGIGYALVWLAMAGPLGLAALLAGTACGPAALPLAIAGALAWSASPLHRRLLNRAHRLRPVSLFGLRADRDCLAFGIEHALLCAATCWAWMLVPLLAGGWHFAVMLGVGIVLLAERLSLPRPPRWRVPAAIALGRHLHQRNFSLPLAARHG